MAVCIYYLPGIIWIYLRHDRELWIQSRWDPVPTKDVSTNLSARISQRAHIKYFIQFGVSPLLPLLAHHTEGHLCFMFFFWQMYEVKCDTFPVNMTPLSVSMLTTRSAHNSSLDMDKLSHCPPTGRATAPTAPMCGHAATKEMHTHRIRKPGHQDWFSSTSILVFQLRLKGG